MNKSDPPKYDLLKIAIAHHRFVWIHPFLNGNGRSVRLFTYALLVKSGFAIHEERILSPTAVFCSNRKTIITSYHLQTLEQMTGYIRGVTRCFPDLKKR